MGQKFPSWLSVVIPACLLEWVPFQAYRSKTLKSQNPALNRIQRDRRGQEWLKKPSVDDNVYVYYSNR